MKPRVKCRFRGFMDVGNGKRTAWVDRLSDHPKLGPPRTESSTRTSLVIRHDESKKEIETLNTIYWWD